MSVTLSELVPNRILLIRLGAVRDGLMTVPLAVEAKRLWPHAKLSWVVDGEMEHLLRLHPQVDEVIRIEPSWLKRPRVWRPVQKLLRERKFDLVLDPQGVNKSAMLGWISGSHTRIGLQRPFNRELAGWLITHKIESQLRHRVDVYRELLSPWMHVESGAGKFEIPHFSDLKGRVEEMLDSLIGKDQPWFVIYPGAIWQTALWPVDRFAMIAKQLRETFDLPGLVVWCGSHEHLMARVIAEQSHQAACVAPSLDLVTMVELCRRAKFVIAGDSDFLQVASSVGTPCVSLHGPTWADEYCSYHNKEFAIQSPFPILSKRSARHGVNSAMQAIEVDEVLYYTQRLLRRLDSHSQRAVAVA